MLVVILYLIKGDVEEVKRLRVKGLAPFMLHQLRIYSLNLYSLALILLKLYDGDNISFLLVIYTVLRIQSVSL